MSKKKIFNMTEIIVQCLAIILLFNNGMFFAKRNECIYHYSLANVCSEGNMIFFLIFIISMFVANIILCLVSTFKNSDEKDGIIHVILPIINTIIMFAMGPMNAGIVIHNTDLFDSTKVKSVVVEHVEPLFFVVIFVLLVIVVIALIKRSDFVIPKGEKQPQQIINNIQETSNADELKKFKELLDSGVITQEEFDQKKKQLLGL